MDTNIVADKRWQISSSTSVRGHYRLTVTVGKLQSLTVNPQSSIDHQVLTNVASQNDSIFVTPPSDIPAGLMAIGIPGSGLVYIRIANVTMFPIDLSSSEFIIDVWKHNLS